MNVIYICNDVTKVSKGRRRPVSAIANIFSIPSICYEGFYKECLCFISGILCKEVLKDRYVADMTNTCVYYTFANKDGKCEQTVHHCPKGKKVSENLYYRQGVVCHYDIDTTLDDPCQRRNSYLSLVYETAPWECYGNTPCCFTKSGQAASDCSKLKTDHS